MADRVDQSKSYSTQSHQIVLERIVSYHLVLMLSISKKTTVGTHHKESKQIPDTDEIKVTTTIIATRASIVKISEMATYLKTFQVCVYMFI